jgi:hypothetical protein
MFTVSGIVMGCGDGESAFGEESGSAVGEVAHSLIGGGTESLSISLPPTETPASIPLAASNSLVLADRAKVLNFNGQYGTISNTGSVQTEVGASARVGSVWSASSLFVRSLALVDGFVYTSPGMGATVQQGGTITGPIAEQPVVAETDLTTWDVVFPGYSTEWLDVNNEVPLAPGSNGNVSVKSGGKLLLSSGTYYFNSLSTEPQGQIVIDESAGPVFLYIRSSFMHKGTLSHVGGGAGDLLVGCTSCSDVFLIGQFEGTLVVPQGKVTLATTAPPYVGSFFAKDIQVAADVVVKRAGFRHWDKVEGSQCDDLAGDPPTESGAFKRFSLCDKGHVATLPPPIRPEDSQRIRDNFDWADTSAVPNFGALGPSLYYALVYVEDRSDLEALDQLQIHYDTLPLFAVERQKWAGMAGTMDTSFDGEGMFVYAVIPGTLYNLIREAALCSDPAAAQEVFRAIKILTVPVAEAAGPDGSLSYEYLAKEGFRYRGLANCPDSERCQRRTQTTWRASVAHRG